MKILLFGKLAESLGRELELDIAGACTIADLRLELARLHPPSAPDLAASRARACINDAIASEDRVAGPADEIAFLPPVSGG